MHDDAVVHAAVIASPLGEAALRLAPEFSPLDVRPLSAPMYEALRAGSTDAEELHDIDVVVLDLTTVRFRSVPSVLATLAQMPGLGVVLILPGSHAAYLAEKAVDVGTSPEVFVEVAPDVRRAVDLLASIRPVTILDAISAKGMSPQEWAGECRTAAWMTVAQVVGARVAAALGQLEPPLRTALHQAIADSRHACRTVPDLAAHAGVDRRTMYRYLAAAGVREPKQLLRAARVLHSLPLAVDPLVPLAVVADWCEYRNLYTYQCAMRSILGVTPREVRYRMTPGRAADAAWGHLSRFISGADPKEDARGEDAQRMRARTAAA